MAEFNTSLLPSMIFAGSFHLLKINENISMLFLVKHIYGS